MAVLLINSYNIDNTELFASYPKLVAEILPRYGAKVLASDILGKVIEGKLKTMNAVIEFPSEEAVINCYNDPDYKKAKKIRHDSTSDISMIIVKKRE